VTVPTPNALLDVVILAIDAAWVGLWALVGLALIGGGLDLLADAFRRWRSR
jgi:hypothetical protein